MGRGLNQAGFWAAVLTTLSAVTFTVAFAVDAITGGPPSGWSGAEAYAATFNGVGMAWVLVPSLILAPSFVALMACLHGAAPEGKKGWSRIGLAFAIMYAVVASLNYTAQLIVVRGAVLDGNLEGLALLAMGNPRSLFWGLAILGYNFYMAMAALLVVPTLEAGSLHRWVGRLFTVNAIVSVAAGVEYFVTLEAGSLLGLVASGVWCVAFPIATALLAVSFRRRASE